MIYKAGGTMGKHKLPFTEEHRRKIGEVRKGNTVWCGRKHTPETLLKMRLVKLGKPRSEATKQKLRIANLGKKQSAETIEKKRLSSIGKHTSEITKEKIRATKLGSKNPAWKGGISPVNVAIRNSSELRVWRRSVYERDHFTCQKCKQKGGKLRAHHVNNFADFPELRAVVENGVTLCCTCHCLFHLKYGKAKNTREQLQEFLS